jgi:hypothetical protein
MIDNENMGVHLTSPSPQNRVLAITKLVEQRVDSRGIAIPVRGTGFRVRGDYIVIVDAFDRGD